jgi:CheY-like chemotaxis protein
VNERRSRSVLCIGNDPIHLNLRCALLKEYGWNVLSSGSGHEGVIRFGQERVDAVILDLNDDGVESALIAGELKRLRPEVPVIMLVAEMNALAPGATDQADAVVVKSEETLRLPDALKAVMGTS